MTKIHENRQNPDFEAKKVKKGAESLFLGLLFGSHSGPQMAQKTGKGLPIIVQILSIFPGASWSAFLAAFGAPGLKKRPKIDVF